MKNQLKCLIWKNWIIRKRHWFVTLIEASLPICIFLLFVYGKSKEKSVIEPNVNYINYSDRKEISFDIDIENINLLYTPNNNHTDNIISLLHTKLEMQSNRVYGFNCENELLEFYYHHSNYTTIGIIFNDLDEKQLNYKIRYHEPHFYNEFLSTNKMIDQSQSLTSERDSPYKNTAFLTIQYMMDTTFLKYHLKHDLSTKFSILIEKFPPVKHKSSVTFAYLEFLPLLTMLAFIYMCPAVLKHVAEEKHSGTKVLLKMTGLNSLTLWLSWFIYGAIPILLAVSGVVFLMKVAVFGTEESLVENSHWSLLFIFLMLYSISALSLCFTISSIFHKPIAIILMGISIWLLSYAVPKYTLRINEGTLLSFFSSINLCLLPNMALHFGYSEIFTFEERGIGLQWNNMYQSSSGDEDGINMCNVFTMMIFDTIFYTSLAIYFDEINPGKFGIRKSYIFPIRDLFRYLSKSKENRVKLEDVENEINLKKIMEISNLSKRFGTKFAVYNFNLDITINEITILLGHNGAGKSTALSMLAGMIEATSGKIKINVRDKLKKIWQIIGYCAQHNMLFIDLTVKEHLIFFARLRGKNFNEAESEALKLLKNFNLSKEKDTMANRLSGGMKRKLCLGAALIGGSKILILDEPSSGMDLQSRREMWDLLLTLRKKVTIIMTTHYMDEADGLGDQIAIMDSGQIISCGTPISLKRKFDTGYHLSLFMKEESTDEQMEELKSIIKSENVNFQVKSQNAKNIVFLLPMEYDLQISNLIAILESKKYDLGIENIRLKMTTLEDVFLKLEDISEKMKSVSLSKRKGSCLIKNDTEDRTKNENLKLIFRTLFSKRLQFLWNKLLTYNIGNTMAFMFIILTVLISKRSAYYTENGPELALRLSSYHKTSVYLNSTNQDFEFFSYLPDIINVIANYKEQVEKEHSLAIEVLDVTKEISKKKMENIAYYKKHMVAGLVLDLDKTTCNLIAMYNGHAIHSLPISLNLLTNSLAKSLLGSNYSISISNWPLPSIKNNSVANLYSESKVSISWMLLLGIGNLFMQINFMVFPQHEIFTNFLKIQYICGMKSMWYWSVNFLFDTLIYLIQILIMTAFLFFFSPILIHGYEWGYLILIFALYGCSGIAFAYLFCRKGCFSRACSNFIAFNLFLGVSLTIIIEILVDSQNNSLINIANYIKYICSVFLPHVGITDTLFNFSKRAVEIRNYEAEAPQHRAARCYSRNHACCIDDAASCYNFKHYDNILNEWFLVFLGCMFYFVLNLILDSYKVKLTLVKIRNILTRKNSKYVNVDRFEHKNNSENCLVTTQLSKRYCGQEIVKSVNLTLERSQCLGILGANGAGKSTTLRMLTKEEVIDSGDIKLFLGENEYDIDTYEYLKNVGYCPQVDSLNFGLTGRQILRTVLNLSSIDNEELINEFLERFGLSKDADVQCGYYSGGNKRKLNLAISLIKGCGFIFLDEPTSGMDPVSRRICWDIIKNIQETRQSSFMLTSHSMIECEALCDMLKIMKDGQFIKEGSLSTLKRNIEGFSLKLKLRNYNKNLIEKIKQYFSNRGEIKDERPALIHFYIKDSDIVWSEIFKEAENIKAQYPEAIEDYVISEVSLEDVFLDVVRQS